MAVEKIEDVLLRYVSNFGRRSSRRGKESVYLYLAQTMEKEFDYPVSIERMGAGWAKIGLAIVGRLEKAETVLIAPLDTPKKTYKPNYRYYPLNDEKAEKQELAAYTVDMLIGILLFAAFGAVCYLFSHSWLAAIAAGWVGWLAYSLSRRNVCNFTKSSASLALVTHVAMERARASGRTRMAYVFIDKNSETRAGVDMFLNRYREQLAHVRNILYLDCLANGEELVISSKKQVLPRLSGLEDELKRADAEETNLLRSHPELIFIMTADSENGDWCVHDLRTVRDKKVDMKRIKRIEEALINL